MSAAESVSQDTVHAGDIAKKPESAVAKEEKVTQSDSVGVEIQSKNSSVSHPMSLYELLRANPYKLDKGELPKINWGEGLKARPPSVEGEQYLNWSTDSDTSSDEEDEPESTERVQTWRQGAYEAVSNYGVEEQVDEETDGFIMTMELPETTPPRPVAKPKSRAKTPTRETSVSLVKEPSAPFALWVVSPLRSPLRKRAFHDLNENQDVSPVSLAKRVRRRPFDDGEGATPALISAPFDDLKSLQNTKQSASNAGKKTTTDQKIKEVMLPGSMCKNGRSTPKATINDTETNDGLSGLQLNLPLSIVPKDVDTSTPSLSAHEENAQGKPQPHEGVQSAAHCVPEVLTVGTANAPPDAEHAQDNSHTPDSQRDDAPSADASPFHLRPASLKLTEAEVMKMMKYIQVGTDGNYHCNYFMGCNTVYSVKSTLKRHLREAHSKERACCPNCSVPFSRNDKFTRERHRCRHEAS